MRYFFPREALPDGEANCDGRIEVTTRRRGTGDDSKSDTDCKAPANLKDTAEGCGIGLGGINVEGSDGCYSRKAGALLVSSPCHNLQKALTHRRRLL